MPMKPGYYIHKPTKQVTEVVNEDGSGLGDRLVGGAVVGVHVRHEDLVPASLRDLLFWDRTLLGLDFDRSKIVSTHVAWASSQNSETWFFADDEREAISQALCFDHKEIWIDDNPKDADPTDVIPTGEWIIDKMLGDSAEDSSTAYDAECRGWLQDVTEMEEEGLSRKIKEAVYLWLVDNNHWPVGLVASGANARRVEVKPLEQEGSQQAD